MKLQGKWKASREITFLSFYLKNKQTNKPGSHDVENTTEK